MRRVGVFFGSDRRDGSLQQVQCPVAQYREVFGSVADWIVYTDQVLHAAMSGRFALERLSTSPMKACSTPNARHSASWSG